MKIIFRILIILTIAAIVSGAFIMVFGVNSNSSAGGQFGDHQDGAGRDGGGFSGTGLLEVLFTLIKIAALVALVTAIQNGIKLLLSMKVGPSLNKS